MVLRRWFSPGLPCAGTGCLGADLNLRDQWFSYQSVSFEIPAYQLAYQTKPNRWLEISLSLRVRPYGFASSTFMEFAFDGSLAVLVRLR